jgi:thiosulfate dehydrogenase (quinone) large subunit
MLPTVPLVTTTVRSGPLRGPRAGQRPRRPSTYLWTSGWTTLPLRVFLGVTFLYAGLQKLADPNFFDANAPGSIQAQLHAATLSSPIGDLLGGLVRLATPIGIGIALAEVAVGVGALLGLWTRVAAAGGIALSVGFLLTISWHSHPYYLGPDIVFAVAWLPLLLAGAGEDPRLSLDGRLRQRAGTEMGLPPTQAVPVAFATVQRLCGGYENDRCRYRHGRACGPNQCPVLTTPATADEAADRLDRRTFLAQARLAVVLVAGGALASGFTAGIGRLLAGNGGGDPVAALPSTGGSPPSSGRGGQGTSTTGPGTTTTSGVPIGPASAVPVGGLASFDDPRSGALAYVVQPVADTFRAFSAVCPHAGCQVGYSRSADEFVCPCHGARFDATGSVLQGPANRSLSAIAITKGTDGQLYVDG